MRELVFGHPLEAFLIGLGIVFIVSWVVVYRFRYAYVGCLGASLILGGIKRGFTMAPSVESILFVLIFVSVSYTLILMAAHSISNVRALQAEREERLAELVQDLKDLTEAAAKRDEDENDA